MNSMTQEWRNVRCLVMPASEPTRMSGSRAYSLLPVIRPAFDAAQLQHAGFVEAIL